MKKFERNYRVVQITEIPPESECEGSTSVLLKLSELNNPNSPAIFVTVKWPPQEVFLGMLVSIETASHIKAALGNQVFQEEFPV